MFHWLFLQWNSSLIFQQAPPRAVPQQKIVQSHGTNRQLSESLILSDPERDPREAEVLDKVAIGDINPLKDIKLLKER